MAIVVQARMSSKRVPGKMVRAIAGKTLLRRVVERLTPAAKALRVDIWVATSSEVSDTPISEACRDLNVRCFRGDLNDVACRYLTLAKQENLEFFVRISGDSPLIDPHLVERAVNLYRETGGDMVTNVYPRTFPPGQSVEVFRSESLSFAYPQMNQQEREHLGPYFYNPEIVARVTNFESGVPVVDGLSMTVDTEEDFVRIEKLFCDYGEEVISSSTWSELVQLMVNQ